MNTLCDLLISFAEVFAAMSPWLVIGFLAAWVIAVMMAYNLIRPVKMAHAKHVSSRRATETRTKRIGQ